ncbi:MULTISPECIES: ACT domain-containing protein [Cyanophyceae]|uniref:ACT domain-containing protein n=1 Tax=Cyanophyceae TaxID=3028117 RepID=UPI0016885EB9|nr:ACT domain-containing protein [Trichocoleus sp. FACHB-69]MBD1935639.1 ACT domain-containing protein [Trichocoleus sp. FACHB-69]
MLGETDLDVLLKSMKPVLRDGEFVFCILSPQCFNELDFQPIGQFQEDEGLTLILKREQADNLGLQYEYISRMITLSVHSNLNAVGFLAAITAKLTEYGISVNPVAAYYHDHLFVPTEKANDAIKALAELSR